MNLTEQAGDRCLTISTIAKEQKSNDYMISKQRLKDILDFPISIWGKKAVQEVINEYVEEETIQF